MLNLRQMGMKTMSNKRIKQSMAGLAVLLSTTNAWAATDLSTLGGRFAQIVSLAVALGLLVAFAWGVFKIIGGFGSLKKLKGQQQQDPTAVKDISIDFAQGIGLMGVTVLIGYVLVSFFGTTAVIDAMVGSTGQQNLINLNLGQ